MLQVEDYEFHYLLSMLSKYKKREEKCGKASSYTHSTVMLLTLLGCWLSCNGGSQPVLAPPDCWLPRLLFRTLEILNPWNTWRFKLELCFSRDINQLLARAFLPDSLPLHSLGLLSQPILFHSQFWPWLEDLRVCVAACESWEVLVAILWGEVDFFLEPVRFWSQRCTFSIEIIVPFETVV